VLTLKAKQGSQAVQSTWFLVRKSLILSFRLVRCADTTKKRFYQASKCYVCKNAKPCPTFLCILVFLLIASVGEKLLHFLGEKKTEKQTGR